MDLIDIDATDLVARLERKEVSAVEVMTACLDRIDAVNPDVNAIVALRDRDELRNEREYQRRVERVRKAMRRTLYLKVIELLSQRRSLTAVRRFGESPACRRIP